MEWLMTQLYICVLRDKKGRIVMTVCEYLQITSINLDIEEYDEYELILKNDENELLKINYQGYIYASSENDIVKHLAEYSTAQVICTIVKKKNLVIYI